MLSKRFTVVFMCFVAAFICYIDRVNISVAVLAMQEDLGWTEFQKGLVFSSFYIGYTLFQIPMGWLTNSYGGKLIMGIALIWWSICTILTPLAAITSLSVLIVVRIAMGAGETGAFPASYNLFSRWIPSNERSRAVAFMVSGIPLGTLFALVSTGWIVERFGWSSVFYVFGVIGILFYFIWRKVIYNSYSLHPSITPKEKKLIDDNINHDVKKQSIPWAILLKKKAVWALIINHFCSNWGFYILLSWLPSYFKSVQGMSLSSAGIASAAPWLTMFIFSNLIAQIVDKLIRRGVPILTLRKGVQTIGLLGSATFLWLVREASDPTEALILICVAMAFLAFTWSGFLPNHLDIAPKYADVLLSITNTAGTLPGIFGVLITGWLIDISGGSYDVVFLLAGVVNIFGCMVWLLFAKAKPILT